MDHSCLIIFWSSIFFHSSQKGWSRDFSPLQSHIKIYNTLYAVSNLTSSDTRSCSVKQNCDYQFTWVENGGLGSIKIRSTNMILGSIPVSKTPYKRRFCVSLCVYSLTNLCLVRHHHVTNEKKTSPPMTVGDCVPAFYLSCFNNLDMNTKWLQQSCGCVARQGGAGCCLVPNGAMCSS